MLVDSAATTSPRAVQQSSTTTSTSTQPPQTAGVAGPPIIPHPGMFGFPTHLPPPGFGGRPPMLVPPPHAFFPSSRFPHGVAIPPFSSPPPSHAHQTSSVFGSPLPTNQPTGSVAHIAPPGLLQSPSLSNAPGPRTFLSKSIGGAQEPHPHGLGRGEEGAHPPHSIATSSTASISGNQAAPLSTTSNMPANRTCKPSPLAGPSKF